MTKSTPKADPNATLAPAWPGPLDAKTRRTLICPRVSSKRQAMDGASMETQEEGMRAFCEARGLEVVERLPYVGTATLRRANYWDRITAGVMSGRYRNVIFWDAARMTRRGPFDGMSRLNTIQEAGGDWYFINPGDLLKGPGGAGILGFFFDHAAMFIPTLREAVNRNLQKRMRGANGADGKPAGGGRPPQGLAWGDQEHGHYVVIEGPTEWGTIEAAYRAKREHGSLAAACRALTAAGYRARSGKAFTAHTLAALLRNPAYKGEVHARRYEWYYTEHETRIYRERPEEERIILTGKVVRENGLGLIPEDEWAATVASIQPAWSAPRETRDPSTHLFRGRLICGYCERRLRTHWGRRRGEKVATYRCNHEHGLNHLKCSGCGVLSAAALDRDLWAEVKAVLTEPGRLDDLLARVEEQDGPRLVELEAARRTVAETREDFEAATVATHDKKASPRQKQVMQARADAQEKALEAAEAAMLRLEAEAAGVGRAADLRAWLATSAAPLLERIDQGGAEVVRKALEYFDVVALVYRPGENPAGPTAPRWKLVQVGVPLVSADETTGLAILSSALTIPRFPLLARAAA